MVRFVLTFLVLQLSLFGINMLGDGLRDTIDPRMSKKL